MYVIGTAGHVDHGKSTLVRALTGIDPDRLREEREREMTIDLGFAWLTLPSGREVSVVDVPGHEDFIKNMLAGIGGVDVAVLVVAADEAVMPQTREHLAIIDLLEISRGVVALTKSDLIDDAEWLALVAEEVREELRGTALAEAPILPVSALTGAGLPELLAELDRQLDRAAPRADLGRPRLPIDRVFTISGFGTVVTGTLLDGTLRVGDDICLVPGGATGRIRGLQTHKKGESQALPGSRVAANLSGLAVEDVQRGQVVTRPGWLRETVLVDARLRLLPDLAKALRHNTELDFYCGTARTTARVRLLNDEALEPGATGWVQFRLAEPLAVARGDRYIVRSASPSATVGGGVIIQPQPGRRYRRFRPEVVARLEALSRGTPAELLYQALAGGRIAESGELARAGGLSAAEVAEGLAALAEEGRLMPLTTQAGVPQALSGQAVPVMALPEWERLLEQMGATLAAYHGRYPLRLGMPREELRSRVRVEAKYLGAVLDCAAAQGRLKVVASAVALAEFTPQLPPQMERAVAQIMAAFAAAPYAPPTEAQVLEAVGGDVLQLLLDQGRLTRLAEGVLLLSETCRHMEAQVRAYLDTHENVTVAQVRDMFDTSRKYVVALLEDLDRRHVTRRVGDARVRW